MKKSLEAAAIELAESVSMCEESGASSPLIDELIRSFYGMAYSVVLYNDAKDIKDKAQELEKARKRLKETEMLLSACYRRRLITEAFNNRAERRLASLKYGVSKALREAEEKAGKTPRRLPPSKNVFSSRRLTVRTFLKGDCDSLIALFNEPFYKECSLTVFADVDSLYEYLKTMPPFYAAARRGSGDIIGVVGIFPDGNGGKRARLEVGIFHEYRGCGYFSELIECAAEFAFKKSGAVAVSAYLPEKRSYLSRALIRLGFEREGVLRSFEKDGENATVYSLIKTE